jgi:hypothetical protein
MEEFNHKHYNYKWTKGFLLALCITLLLLSAAVFAQTFPNTPSGYSIDGQTGNLIPNGALTSGSGWSSSSGSPGWVPNASPLGSFSADGYTFSYQMEELGKSGINLGGFNLGYTNTSAIFVTGFSYGLQYRFPCANQIGGNCTDTNGLQDNLSVEVGYYPASGAPTFYLHQLGLKNINDGNPAYNPNWQTLAETVTFAGAKTLAQAGAVNMGIVGQDAGFWACLGQECYGPQVKNAYVKANYSVDPCILNPAFNPSCPGFQNILQGNKSPTFYYSYNIAQSLPHIGGGVVLHGYDYGFNWYNYGACYNTFLFWCTDWRTDGGGNINFRISDKNNTTMLQQQWYVSGNNNAGSFSSRHLFTENKNSLDMGNIQWWASDVWNHFGWVGWTRPIWTPDPCYTNGLYSPNCSNFQQTLTQVVADIKAQQEKIAALNPSSTSLTPTGSVTVTLNDVNSTNPSVTVTTLNEPTQQNNRSGVSQAQTLVATEIPAVVARNANQNARTLSVAQRAIVEANQTASSSMKEAESIADNSVQTSIASSMGIQENEQGTTVNAQVNRINQMNITSSIAQPFTQSTQQVATTNREELPIQATSVTPITMESAAQILMPNAMFKSVELAVALPNLPPVNPTRVQEEKQEQSFTLSSQEQPSVFVQPVAPPDIQQAYAPPSITTLPLQAPANVTENPVQVLSQPVTPVAVTEAEQPQQQRNFTTDKTNPINDIIDSKPVVAEQRIETNLAAVNRNAQNNEVAGGVDINNIAVTPVGFSAYNVALRDVAFYAPKEIYRNQRTVDNVRALRNLASDRLHQEMVDQQYLPR